MRKMRFVYLAFIMTAMLVVWGCSNGGNNNTANPADTTAAPSTGTNTAASGSDGTSELVEEINYPVSQAIPTLDPHLALNTNTNITHNIFEGLFAFNSNFEPVPMLAESYDLSEDGKVYTFHLRQGVLFHNGKEMKADDVVASLNRWKSLVARAKALMGDSEFTKVDDYTVELSLATPKNDVLVQLSHVLNYAAIMPKEIVDAAPATGVTEYIGTGPYQFVEWKQDQYVKVSRFADYKPSETPADGLSGVKKAKFNNVYFKLALDSTTRLSSFLSGDFKEVDVSVDNLPQLSNTAGVTINKRLASDLNIVFNKKSKLFSNVKYREAVAAVMNADQIMLGVVSDPELYRLNSSYMYKENNTFYSEKGAEMYNQNNPDKAKALLAEAGYNGEEVVILTTKELGGLFYNASVMLGAQLESIGMKVKIDIYDFATLLTKRGEEGSWDIYPGVFTMPAAPSQLLYIYPTYGFADDAKLAELVGKLTAAIGADNIKTANDELQQYIWEYLPVIKVGDIYNYYAVKDEMNGLTITNGIPNLANFKTE